jgi:hypothetical protein
VFLAALRVKRPEVGDKEPVTWGGGAVVQWRMEWGIQGDSKNGRRPPARRAYSGSAGQAFAIL